MTPDTQMFNQFIIWAAQRGYDIAHTYDTERSKWVALNPMTADLWEAWQASRSTHTGAGADEVGFLLGIKQACAAFFKFNAIPTQDATAHHAGNTILMIESAVTKRIMDLGGAAHQGGK